MIILDYIETILFLVFKNKFYPLDYAIRTTRRVIGAAVYLGRVSV